MYILDETKPHQKYFEEMTRIPHGTCQEKRYADYLEDFARQRGLSFVRDAMDNVVIYQKGTPGYENLPPVILQAHTDMVCEKNQDCGHNFETDALDIYVEDGYVKARGTTLGADDGVGCAYMLAILDSKLPHPPLECAFTVQEEIGLKGAFALKPEYFQGKRYLNLDFGGLGNATGITSAGGILADITRPVSFAENTMPAYRIFITGLSGGHSGSSIHKEKGNALKICARLLEAARQEGAFRLVRLEGGEKCNAIPRECEAVFASSVPRPRLREVLETLAEQIRREFRFQEPGLTVLAEPFAQPAPEALSEEESLAALRLFYLLPTGVRGRSVEIEGLITASENLASVRMNREALEFQYCIRAEKRSVQEQMETELEMLAQLCGARIRTYSYFPSWEYNPDSQVRKVLTEAYREQTGREMEQLASHIGLECGVFCSLIPGLDVATLGALTENAHTPEERLHLASFDSTFDVLAAFLKKLGPEETQ